VSTGSLHRHRSHGTHVCGLIPVRRSKQPAAYARKVLLNRHGPQREHHSGDDGRHLQRTADHGEVAVQAALELVQVAASQASFWGSSRVWANARPMVSAARTTATIPARRTPTTPLAPPSAKRLRPATRSCS
jgi:hypothetical protein